MFATEFVVRASVMLGVEKVEPVCSVPSKAKIDPAVPAIGVGIDIVKLLIVMEVLLASWHMQYMFVTDVN
jgi:hypothetical protein